MNNIKNTVDSVIQKVKNYRKVTIKILVGHADEFYMDGSYERDDDKFVWYQISTDRISRETLVAKYDNYEDCDVFAKQLMVEIQAAQKEHPNIVNVMMI